MAAVETKVSPSNMSTAIINGHQTSSEDFTKHVFGGKLFVTKFLRHFANFNNKKKKTNSEVGD